MCEGWGGGGGLKGSCGMGRCCLLQRWVGASKGGGQGRVGGVGERGEGRDWLPPSDPGARIVCDTHHLPPHPPFKTTTLYLSASLFHPPQIQEHAFNTPFQLASPQFLPACDRPQGGLTYSARLAQGDVLVAGSDGLFDNMWDTQLAELVATALRWVCGCVVVVVMEGWGGVQLDFCEACWLCGWVVLEGREGRTHNIDPTTHIHTM